MSDYTKKTATPSSYPMPGTYDVDYMHIYMASMTVGAKIYYTLDGSTPTRESNYFDPIHGSVSVWGFGEAGTWQRNSVVIKAIAVADGLEDSDVATWIYNYDCNIPKGGFASEVLRDRTEDMPGLIKFYDYARVNMYLVIGSTGALLIDGGMDYSYDLYPEIMRVTGGLPLQMAMPHGHGDHIYQAKNMIKHGVKIYAPEKDWYMMESLGEDVISSLIDLKEGDVFDLGNTRIETISLPGHTPGHVVLLDEKTGDLYSSDAIGTSDPWGPNSGLVSYGYEESTMEKYWPALEHAREMINGRAQRIWTGHNTLPITPADLYLDNCIHAAKEAFEKGDAALIRSTRPFGSAGQSEAMIGVGDYRTDLDSVAIHVRYYTLDDLKNDRPANGYKGIHT